MHPGNTGNSPAVEAGIYCRISLAAMGDTTKIDDQERICRDLAERLGWNVADVYPDHSRSAWQLNRKRPQWNRMLADVNAGRINGIITYHGDRLVRQHEDLSALIRLSRSKGVRLASPTGTRDLDNYDDQFILEIECSMAKRESANTSRRRKQQYERYRREGRVRPGGPGGRSFGFDSDNLTPRPAEFELIREAAGRILRGETAYSVCRDWNARGLTATTGNPWRNGNLGPMLALPRYAGLMPDGESAAAWPAALDRETWEQVRLILETRRITGLPNPSNARRHLLSGIALCGPCETPLLAAQMRRVKARDLEAELAYSCKNPGCRKIARKAEHLDAYVTRRVVNLLNDPRQPDGELPVRQGDAPEWAALARERAETEQQVRDYSGSSGRIGLLMTRLDQIDARMAALRELEAHDARSRLLDRYRGITMEQFRDEPLEVRRALVAASFRITVLPASVRGRGGFRTEDVLMEPIG